MLRQSVLTRIGAITTFHWFTTRWSIDCYSPFNIVRILLLRSVARIPVEHWFWFCARFLAFSYDSRFAFEILFWTLLFIRWVDTFYPTVLFGTIVALLFWYVWPTVLHCSLRKKRKAWRRNSAHLRFLFDFPVGTLLYISFTIYHCYYRCCHVIQFPITPNYLTLHNIQTLPDFVILERYTRPRYVATCHSCRAWLEFVPLGGRCNLRLLRTQFIHFVGFVTIQLPLLVVVVTVPVPIRFAHWLFPYDDQFPLRIGRCCWYGYGWAVAVTSSVLVVVHVVLERWLPFPLLRDCIRLRCCCWVNSPGVTGCVVHPCCCLTTVHIRSDPTTHVPPPLPVPFLPVRTALLIRVCSRCHIYGALGRFCGSVFCCIRVSSYRYGYAFTATWTYVAVVLPTTLRVCARFHAAAAFTPYLCRFRYTFDCAPRSALFSWRIIVTFLVGTCVGGSPLVSRLLILLLPAFPLPRFLVRYWLPTVVITCRLRWHRFDPRYYELLLRCYITRFVALLLLCCCCARCYVHLVTHAGYVYLYVTPHPHHRTLFFWLFSRTS